KSNDKVGKVHRFHQISVCSQLHASQAVLLATPRTHHYHTVWPKPAQILQYTESIFSGQADVNKHDIHGMCMQVFPERFRAALAPYPITFYLEKESQFFLKVRVVLQNGNSYIFSLCHGEASLADMGIDSSKQLPSGLLRANSSSPPCARTICLAT